MSQGQPAFPPRNAFASSTKLPDRTFNSTTTQPTLAQSAFARRPEQSYASSSQAAPPPQHVFGPGHGRESMERDSNFLAELSVEQRDECNEAVSVSVCCASRVLTFLPVPIVRPRSRQLHNLPRAESCFASAGFQSTQVRIERCAESAWCSNARCCEDARCGIFSCEPTADLAGGLYQGSRSEGA